MFYFHRQPNGNYRFENEDGQTFEARKCNVTGWELYEISWTDGRELSQRRSGWYPTRYAAASAVAKGPRCESGWTGDRCTFPLFHFGRHSND